MSYTILVEKVKEIIISKSIKLDPRRFDVFFMLIELIINLKTCNLSSIACLMNPEVKKESNMRRLNRFFREVNLPYDFLGKIVLNFFEKKKFKLIIDRTNWKFGRTNINFLFIGAYWHGISVPLIFCLLPKRGNSSCKERLALLDQLLSFLPADRIALLIGDREFIGKAWLTGLKERNIPFLMRIRKNMKVTYKNEKRNLSSFFKHSGDKGMRPGIKYYFSRKNVLLNDVVVNIIGHKGTSDDEILYLVTNEPVNGQLDCYGERWSIESFFSAIKTRGFNVECVRMVSLERLHLLMVCVSIAFCFCLWVGHGMAEGMDKIREKGHGYPSTSFFQHGLSCLIQFREWIKSNKEYSCLRMDFLFIMINSPTLFKLHDVYRYSYSSA